jgi:hypothetical protein
MLNLSLTVGGAAPLELRTGVGDAKLMGELTFLVSVFVMLEFVES